MDRMWERSRGGRREVEQERERDREREKYPGYQGRAGDTELRERDRRREEGRHINGRISSVQNCGEQQERVREKGDTFPRTRRQSIEMDGRPRHPGYLDNERGMGKLRDLVKNESERERERAKQRDRDIQRYRERERERENERARIREEIKRDGGARPEKESESDRRRERGWDLGRRERRGERDVEVNDQQFMKSKEVERETARAGQRDREDSAWLYSMQRRRIMEGDTGNFSDQDERDERSRPGRRERHRHTKSEGDSEGEIDSREVRRKENLESPRYDQSRREGDKNKERLRDTERHKKMEPRRSKDRGQERETDIMRYRERELDKEWIMERPREGYRERYRERNYVREERGPDRPRDGMKDTQDRRREKELSERKRRECEREMHLYQEQRVTERQRGWEGGETGRNNQTQTDEHRKIQVEAQSSGDCMSGIYVEREQKRTEMKDSDDKERDHAANNNREKMRSKEWQDVTVGQGEGEAREGYEKEEMETERDRERKKTGSNTRAPRKMWLEPRSGTAKTESLEDKLKERERARERYAWRYKINRRSIDVDEAIANSKYATEIISLEDRYRQLEIAGEFMKDVDGENMEEKEEEFAGTEPVFASEEGFEGNTEGSDRGEERGSGGYGDCEGGEGSEWEVEMKERVTSADDGFVTVSSGGDEDEGEEDTFEDCNEFWDGGVRGDLTRQSPTRIQQSEGEIETKMAEERSDRTVTVFCVVGQTLPRSRSNQNPHMEPMEQEDASQHNDVAAFRDTETEDEATQESCGVKKAEKESKSFGQTFSEVEITVTHDTTLEKAECDDEVTQEVTSSQDLQFTGSVSAEKDTEPHPPESSETSTLHAEDHESSRKKMTDGENRQLEVACDTVQENKRHSSAPHVKWAKNVLKEILGTSEDGSLNMPEPDTQTVQPSDGAPAEADPQEHGESSESPTYSVVHKPREHSSERRCIDTDLMHAKSEDIDCARHLDTKIDTQNKILIQVKELDTEEELDEETDEEEYDYDKLLLPSPDINSLSSDGEAEKEGTIKKDEKQKRKKSVWDVFTSSSFRDLGNEARGRRKGFRKNTMEKHSEDEDGEAVGRDRRPRVYATDEDDYVLCHSLNESEFGKFKANISRMRMRKSKYYNSQLYQQYSEVVQNREILHQSNSHSSSIFGEVGATQAFSSPCPSPPPARRPLPPLPPVLYPSSLTHSNSLSIGAIATPKPISPRLSRSFASSPMLWQELPGVKNSPDLKNLSDDERRLQEVRFEVVTSEASYCSSLDIVVEHFVKSKYLNGLLTTQDKNWLFSRLSDVRAISHSFYTQLEERVESDTMHFTVCDIIIKHCPRFRAVYVPYLTNQSYQDKTYQKLMNESSRFRQVVEKLEQSPKCQRLPFRSFLILPFQRITRLKLLVQNIVKRTDPKTKDEAQAIKAMKLLEKMIQDSNESISQMKSIESLLSLNARVDFECKTLPLISQSRRLVREGPVTELRDFALKETERSAYMHLFNDYLLLSLRKEGGRFTVIDHAPVSELRAENCRVKLHSLKKNLFRLFMSQKSLLLRTETQADKLRWISAVSRPHPEIDFSAAQDIPQMQCIRAFVAQQPDEISLEKADVLLVHQQSRDGWVEGTRLSDRHRGWAPESHLEIIHSEKARQCNLVDALKITAATATV